MKRRKIADDYNYQTRALEFQVGDQVRLILGSDTDTGRVVEVYAAIGMLQIQWPNTSSRHPVEDVQKINPGEAQFEAPKFQTVPGGMGTAQVSMGPPIDDIPINNVKPLVENVRRIDEVKKIAQAFVKKSLYWHGANRQYRCKKSELGSGNFLCPKRNCQGTLRNAIYKREDGQSVRLLACPECLFLIRRQDVIDNSPCESEEKMVLASDKKDLEKLSAFLREVVEGIHQSGYFQDGRQLIWEKKVSELGLSPSLRKETLTLLEDLKWAGKPIHPEEDYETWEKISNQIKKLLPKLERFSKKVASSQPSPFVTKFVTEALKDRRYLELAVFAGHSYEDGEVDRYSALAQFIRNWSIPSPVSNETDLMEDLFSESMYQKIKRYDLDLVEVEPFPTTEGIEVRGQIEGATYRGEVEAPDPSDDFSREIEAVLKSFGPTRMNVEKRLEPDRRYGEITNLVWKFELKWDLDRIQMEPPKEIQAAFLRGLER